jgi:hypothetical protein
MSNDQTMRDMLMRKLNDPGWKAKKEQEYDQIVDSDQRDIFLTVRPSRSEPKSAATSPISDAELFSNIVLDGPDFPVFEEPTTIDELWQDRWQQSSGAYTLTRLLDDTIRLDYPDGERYLYRLQSEPEEGFWWEAEEFNAAGRRIHSKRTTDRFTEYGDALFDMHRAALADYQELTSLL